MLCLLFQLGDALCAVEAARLVEVLSFVQLGRARSATPGLAGMLDYHGESVPVLDACLLHLGRPSHARLSTRIILFEPAASAHGPLLGMVVERATEALPLDRAAFAGPGAFGPTGETPRGPAQWVELDSLVPAGFRAPKAAQAEVAA